MEFQITSAGAIHIAVKLFWYWLNILIVAVEIRFLVNWFLNINPYFEPFLSLWAWTNPVFCFGRSLYPKVLGIDVTPLINYRILAWFQRIVDNYVHGVNDTIRENDDMSDFDDNEMINGNMPITLPGSNFLPVESKLTSYLDFLGHTDFFDFHSFL
jgi:uncharacterized protein YggT (Ycf19 family)|tara:strand:- start:4192 stop:4659 length:468 start_codon:yes stop_codon:yes gene_type:complete